MKEGIIRPRTNTTLFNYSSSTGGCLTYLWWTMSSLKYKPVDGWEDTRIRVYVDDEAEASIIFALYLGIGVGFHDQTGPWGGRRSGKLGRNMGGVYLTYRIPFAKTVRVEAETIVTESMIYWTTMRGVTGAMPVVIGDFMLPATARLRLQKQENKILAPLEYLNITEVDGHGGAVLQVGGCVCVYACLWRAGVVVCVYACVCMCVCARRAYDYVCMFVCVCVRVCMPR